VSVVHTYGKNLKSLKTIVNYSQLILSLTLIAARYLQLLALVEWYAIESNSLVSLCTLHQGQDNLEDLRYDCFLQLRVLLEKSKVQIRETLARYLY
jgi:hypothetical protein